MEKQLCRVRFPPQKGLPREFAVYCFAFGKILRGTAA